MTKRTADAAQALAAAILSGTYYEQGGKYDDDAAVPNAPVEQIPDVAGDAGDTRDLLCAAVERGHPQADYYLSLLNGNSEDEKKTVIQAAHRWKRGA